MKRYPLERFNRHVHVRNMIRKMSEQLGGVRTVVYLLAVSLILAGCGGGSAAPQIISGVTSVGLPLTGYVKIKDNSTPVREKTTVIGKDGSFAFDVSDMKKPYILEAQGSAGGTNYALYSFAESPGIANITPLSNIAVAAAAGTDDPDHIYAHPDPVTLQKIKSDLPVAIATLQFKLKPLFDLYDVGKADPIKDHFRINHAGFNALFDNVKFVLSNGNLTIVNATTGTHIFTSKVAYVNVGKFVNLLTPYVPNT